MPATEQTWRDQKKLHFLFAITGTILFVATVWMFLKDHQRQWKKYQSAARDIQLKAEDWKKTAVQTVDSQRQHEQLQSALLTARATPVPEPLYAEFKERVNEDVASREGESGTKEADFARLDELQAESTELGQVAVQAREEAPRLAAEADKLEADATTALVEKDNADRAVKAAATPEAKATAQADLDAKSKRLDSVSTAATTARTAEQEANEKALAAEQAAAQSRGELVERLSAYVKAAKFREDNLLGTRKFANANLDKAKADEGLVVRDFSGPGKEEELAIKLAEKEKTIHEIDQRVSDLTLQYQAAAAHRKALQNILKQITATEDKLKKELEANRADLVRVEKAIEDKRSTYVVWWGMVPTPGKKLLEAPILDAFNSPLKIENLWSEGLTIDYNFREVKRYDRCTTCHQMMEKSQPGAADKPGFVKERLLTLILTPPTAERLAELKKQAKETGKPLAVEDVYGVSISGSGLADRNAVSITNVLDGSLATQARLKLNEEATEPISGDAARDMFLQINDQQPYELDDPANPFAATSGLNVGDVFVDVDGSLVYTEREAERFLLEGAEAQKPLHILVRRGLKNPFTSHPRLDLFVGSLSPHKMQEFACTICHEGQGSATDFKYGSHTPNTVDQAKRWKRDYGWFDNHHWIYPMNAKRFAEASCLKCHHDVVDLEASQRFAEAPAPKVVHGYNLIRKYGCYGCHEMNGYDGPNKRIGPDLRLEPNHFAAAQQLKADPNYEKLSGEEKEWVDTVISHPERSPERTRLYEMLLADKEKDSRLTVASQNLAPLFKDIEAAGTLRKVGPSLRYSDNKLDEAFLYDWISNPKRFRPSTRMPRVFGLHDHLEGEGLEVAKKYEPLEVQGIASYLKANSQKFEYLDPPAEVNATASAERGKVQFQTRGCLACHSHGDFAEAEDYRGPHEIVQGPDLSGLAKKFDPQRNPKGRQWLYSWIKEPTRYHARTVMPNLYLNPVEVTTAGKTEVTDPVADIVEYLMSSTAGAENWQPVDAEPSELSNTEKNDLQDLLLEHLKDAFAVRTAEQYAKTGIPASRKDELKSAEYDLVLADGQKELSEEQKLVYIGRKSIAKYGCYGCHDIPGFEDAKPIGAGLNDWGRKEPAKLAFEHIAQYLEHGHGHAGHGSHGGKSKESAEDHRAGEDPDHKKDEANPNEDARAKAMAEAVEHGKLSGEHAAHGHAAGEHADEERGVPDYFMEQIFHGNRIGFLYQKLREPRSYDYHKTENKKYNDRLRMPLFPFNDEDREAVMTFVLGLVADPPAEKYVYSANERNKAIVEGQKVLEKYNCQGCHILKMEEWTLSLPKDGFGAQITEDDRSKIYPFLLPHVSPDRIAATSMTDRRGMNRAKLAVMPRVEADGRPSVNDEEGEALDPEAMYDPSKLTVYFDLWEPAVIAGQSFMVGIKPMNAPMSQIEERHAPHGGFLTRYLIPVVTKLDAAESGAPKGAEAMGWLPPPLVGEGHKVQSEWLHEFLLEPYPIRPAVFMRMPKFNMSEDEAAKLAAYFAAIDNAEYPYGFTQRRQESFLDQAEAEYQNRLARKEEGEKPEGSRFDGAMRIVTSNDYCVKCHIVGNFVPGMNQPTKPSARALAPDLSRVYKRFRPDYLREWIANPKTKLPYTAMPVNIPYDVNAPHLGGVSQELYHGTSVEQVDALVDLLMNFDAYSKGKTDVASEVKPAPAAAPAEDAPAAETSSGE